MGCLTREMLNSVTVACLQWKLWFLHTIIKCWIRQLKKTMDVIVGQVLIHAHWKEDAKSHHTFKKRWNNSKQEQKNPAKENSTELSKHVWKLKRNNIAYDIDWSVAAIAKPYTRETGRCQLCTMERVFIARQDSSGLNRRSEIVNKCIHKKKNVLENWLWRCF